LRSGYDEGGKLMLRTPDGAERVLTERFQSAADPEVSFDAKRILFAGKRSAGDHWSVYEMNADGSNTRQLTREPRDCRNPVYLSKIFYLDDPAPVFQVAFVCAADRVNEYGGGRAADLYTIRLDGSGLRRLTYNASSSTDPATLPDGRMLFSSWQRSHVDRGTAGRIELMGLNVDGTDLAAFSGRQGRRIQRMAAVTTGRLVVFVEAQNPEWDGAGSLASINLRRNLKSYKPLTTAAQGLFHSPSALPDGTVLVSRRTAGSAHRVYRFDAATGKLEFVLEAPGAHAIQARAVTPRAMPDGRSSVVDEKADWAKLYCFNVYESDLGLKAFAPGLVKRIRVLEGLSRLSNETLKQETLSPLLQRRFLGEVDVEDDGSFHIEIPANIPVQIQALDNDGMALRSTPWIWAKNKEQRGCIGCHEDGERTPENVMAKALTHPAAQLTLAPERRRTIDFEQDITPVLTKCAVCHDGSAVPRFTRGRAAYDVLFKYTTPGRARTSPLVWHIFGRNTSRPWDAAPGKSAPAIKPMPPKRDATLSDEERRTIIEWIDLGAHYRGLPAAGGAK
jgi:Tol biopolymer transport system component